MVPGRLLVGLHHTAAGSHPHSRLRCTPPLPRSFFRSCAYVRSVAGRMQQQQQQQAAAAGQQFGYPPPASAAGADPPTTPPQQFLQTALVDPSGE